MNRTNVMSLDAMQKIINSFRQVERKIDRLQDDFLNQSKTLNDLRIMVGTLHASAHPPGDNEENLIRNKIDKHNLSQVSLKRKQTGNAPKVNKAKSYEPVASKGTHGSKRPLKIKKTEGQKKPLVRNRSARKAVNEMDSPIIHRAYAAKNF